MTKSHQPAAKQSAAPPVVAAASPLQLRPFAPRQDDLEQDGMADLMARAMDTQLMDMPVDAPGKSVQRQPDAREEEELPVQPKLSIGQPGDKYEQEADQMAARVMRMPGGDFGERGKGKGEGVQRQALPGEKEEEEEVQMRPAVQREVMPAEEEEEETLQARLQAKGEASAVPENFEGQLAQHKGGGRPLSDETRGFMEPRFGADFSNVRVHETPDLANAIQAQAFTHGQDIYFNSGKYSPGSSSGKELLAHELTHVVQQDSGKNAVQLKPLRFETDEIGRAFSNGSYIEFDPTCIAWVNGKVFTRVNHSNGSEVGLEKQQRGIIQIKMPVHIFEDIEDGLFSEETLFTKDRNHYFNVIANWNFKTDKDGNITTKLRGKPYITGTPKLGVNIDFMYSSNSDTVSLSVQLLRASRGSSASYSKGGVSIGSSWNLPGQVFWQRPFTFDLRVYDMVFSQLEVERYSG
ncbi:MAG: DUF4157 domain-containing protein [Cyanobacteria bacterium P01_H01_bin.26]